MNIKTRNLIGLLLMIPLVLAGVGAAFGGDRCFLSKRAGDWESLFIRTAGWTTGADGIYAIPLNGNDSPGGTSKGWTLMVFGDTLIGRILPGDVRSPDTVMVKNSAALLYGDQPDPQTLSFFWGTDDQGQPAAVFQPDTPGADPGEWYWLMDGVVIDHQLYLFAMRLKMTGTGNWDYAVDGVALLSHPSNRPLEFSRYRQTDVPLFLPRDETGKEMVFGCAIMTDYHRADNQGGDNQGAGSPRPDGFVYVYGTLNGKTERQMLVARVTPDHFTDFSQWRFWNGSGWDASIRAAAPVLNRLSQEFSVTPIGPGCYAAVFQLDGLGPQVVAALAPTPHGPFGDPITIWTCPEPEDGQQIYVYNAKAHPHLSRPGELLITYNVNSFDSDTLLRNADIYRPRFIRTWKFGCYDGMGR